MGLANPIKTVLPWLCILALIAGMFVLRARSKDKETELAALRQANQELSRVRAENEELKKVQVQAEELTRLRKENEELHRLRNEVHQLREEKQQAAKTAQPASAPAPSVKPDPASQQKVQQQLQQLMAENERLRAEMQQIQQARLIVQADPQLAQVNACINNLRQIDGAKQQWALENKKAATAVPSAQDIQPYFPNNAIPACPAGGVYTLNSVETLPTCNIPGHVLAQQ